MAQLTFAAIWTKLTIQERQMLAAHFKCSMPILALKMIPEYWQTPAALSCDCASCHVGQLFTKQVGAK